MNRTGSLSSTLRDAGFIARKELAYQLRQRETLLWTFVMPILFFYFIGTVTGGFGSPGGSAEAPDPLALHAPSGERGGFLVDELVRGLEGQNFRVVRFAAGEAQGEGKEPTVAESTGGTTGEPGEGAEEAAGPAFEDYARRLTVPDPPAGYPSFTAAVLDGHRMALRFGREGDGPSAQFDEVRVARAVYGVVADLALVADSGEPASPEAFARLAAMPRTLELDVRPAGERLEAPSGFEQAIPGTLVMFTMLVMLTSGAILLVGEREKGLLRRLASTPISRTSVVLGKLAGKTALGFVQVGFGMAAGTALFGMGWGAALPMLLVVLVGWAVFNGALGTVLGNLARTEPQASGIGVVTTMLLAALGGCWWPIEITPEWMQTLALTLPTGWTMDAVHKLVSFGYGPASALPHLAALVLGSIVLVVAAVRTFRYQ